MKDTGNLLAQTEHRPAPSADAAAGGWHLGARPLADGSTAFRVWAPFVEQVEVHVVHPEERLARLVPEGDGYHVGRIQDCGAGARYRYRLDRDAAREHADPASRHQPDGVTGPSAVVAPYEGWTDDTWSGLPHADSVIYELHVGTYTDEGTFEAVIPHLDTLVSLGVTVVELMPVAQFPGGRNWGYDGVLPFATQDTYGGPTALARLVDACHARGLAVALDVVYNHLGPEGSVLHHFGPYFTDRYKTPWGAALNFDGRRSDPVRRFFIENALYWTRDLHIDMLRLDAVHAINDMTARPFLHELTEAVHVQAAALRRRVQVIAESAANDPRLLRVPEIGGFGMDGQWNDDFHHALHALLTGERHGYYADFGGLGELVKAYTSGYVFTGQYSRYRGRRHGAPPIGIPLHRYVVYAQNHDQTGNRFLGERLANLVGFEALKVAAGVVCLSPSIPMLFMGEEHGEDNPFLYFTSHSGRELAEAVRRGRKEEGKRFGWTGDAPDPQGEETFARSRPDHAKRESGRGRTLWRLHQTLLRLRRELPALHPATGMVGTVRADPADRVLCVERRTAIHAPRENACLVVYNLSPEPTEGPVHFPSGRWRRVVDSAAAEWDGPGDGTPYTLEAAAADGENMTLALSPWSFVVYADTS